MPQRGYSGATLRLFDVRYTAKASEERTVSLLVKVAPLIERQALARLGQLKLTGVPFNYAPDLATDGSAPVCLQYLHRDEGRSLEAAMSRAAEELAALHLANLGQRKRLAWAPPADRRCLAGGYVLATWRQWWQHSMADAAFVGEYGPYEAPLATAAERFLDTMDALWQEDETLTLIHGDLHDGNVVIQEDAPYFVDWGQARYGSFYLDLPNLFSPAPASLYHQALAQRGYVVPLDEFEARYREAGRYVGFKYMGFVLSQWPDRDRPDSPVRGYLDNLIRLALHGA